MSKSISCLQTDENTLRRVSSGSVDIVFLAIVDSRR